VVVLSHEYWTTVRASDPAVIGKPVLVNGHAMSIIGVAPSSFRGLDVAKVPTLWIPVMMKRQATPDWDRLLDRRAVWMHVFGRLKPGVTAEQAQAGLQPWFQSILEADGRRRISRGRCRSRSASSLHRPSKCCRRRWACLPCFATHYLARSGAARRPDRRGRAGAVRLVK
jgi:hypothetical protein